MFNQLHRINDQDFNLINKANIILLPNKLEAKSMGDFWHNNLIPNVAMIFSKLLANRMEPLLNSPVFKSQSAFIKWRCIQDNFMYVQKMVWKLQKMKTPALFLKLNSQEAFDIVYWSHLIENVASPRFQTTLVRLDFHHLQHGKVKGNTEWSIMWPGHS